MKIFKQAGSKDRLFEMIQKVNKIKLNEDLNSTNNDSIVNTVFEEIKNGTITVTNTETQSVDDNTFIVLSGKDANNNICKLTFKVLSKEGDQEGVYSVNNVQLKEFSHNNAAGTQPFDLNEDDLKQFNAEHGDELYDIVREYLDIESDEPAADESNTDELYEEAIKKIDSYPINFSNYSPKKIEQFPDGKMKDGSTYADEQPVNPNLRVSAEELEKYVNENINSILHYSQAARDKGSNFKTKLAVSYQHVLMNALQDIGIKILNIEDIDNKTYKLTVEFNGETRNLNINGEKFNNAAKVRELIKKALKINGGVDEMALLRKTDKITPDKYKAVAVHLWDSLTTGVKVAIFLPKDGNWVLRSPKGIIFAKQESLDSPEIAYIQGQAAKEFLAQYGYKIKDYNKTLEKVGNTPNVNENGTRVSDINNGLMLQFGKLSDNIKQDLINTARDNVKNNLINQGTFEKTSKDDLLQLILKETLRLFEKRSMGLNENESDYPNPIGKEFKPETHYPKKKKKITKKVKIKTNESTDRDKFENVVFLQGDEAFEPLERLDREGVDAALEYLKQWHYPGQHDGSQAENHGRDDKTYRKDGYIMSWNSNIGYIGLQYDLSQMNEVTYDGYDQDNETDPRNLEDPDDPYGEDAAEDREANNFEGGTELEENDNTTLNVHVPQGEMNGENDSTSLKSSGDNNIEQLAQDKKEQGEILQGGKGDGKSPLEFNVEEVMKGLDVEKEHTNDPLLAIEIVMDHLSEDPEYYTAKDTPEASAQAGASTDVPHESGAYTQDGMAGKKDRNGHPIPAIDPNFSQMAKDFPSIDNDEEMTDRLLGYKPKNVGDSIDEELNTTQKPNEKFSTVEKNKHGMTYLFAYPDERGIETREGLNNWESKDSGNRELQFVNNREEGIKALKTFSESKESELKQSDPATWHQIQIAKKTVRMPNAMANVMGGMSKEEAEKILTQRGIKFEENYSFDAAKDYENKNAYSKYQQYMQMSFNDLTDDQKEEFFQLWQQFKENK